MSRLFLFENSYFKYKCYKQFKKKRSSNVIFKRRTTDGEFHNLYRHLLLDEIKFFEYYRMTPLTFKYILCKIEKKKNENC